MSHGSIEKCEPNLIPMLDMILQLIMFFMLVANFMADDLNTAVLLPHANQARPLHKSEDYVITLNVDKEGRVLLLKVDPDHKRLESLMGALGKNPKPEQVEAVHDRVINEKVVELVNSKNGDHPLILDTQSKVITFMELKKKVDDARIAKAKEKDPNSNPQLSLVVVRAHKNATYGRVNSVLEGCHEAGYKEVQLRAVIGPKN